MIRAILYDLDGVLVDACDWHYEALNRALRELLGIQIDREEHKTTFNGLPTMKKLQKLVMLGRILESDIDAISNLKQKYTTKTIDEFAGLDKTKVELHEHMTRSVGIPIACVTNSVRSTAELMLERTGQLKYMSFIVSNEDVTYPKPSAEGYIQSMVRLSSQPHQTLIVEDSDVGIAAATASCARVLHVDNASNVTLDIITACVREFTR